MGHNLPCASAKVLLVNDTVATRDAIAGILRARGLTVAAFANGQTALTSPDLTDADIIISDVSNRPNGVYFWEQVRAQGVLTPFVFLSAHASEVADKLSEAVDGPAGYVGLPFTDRQLVATIMPLVRGRALVPAAASRGSR